VQQVSNGLITQDEYDRAKKRADRAGAKFITKGDVQQALEKLQHAHRSVRT
jgi:histone H3/H4